MNIIEMIYWAGAIVNSFIVIHIFGTIVFQGIFMVNEPNRFILYLELVSAVFICIFTFNFLWQRCKQEVSK